MNVKFYLIVILLLFQITAFGQVYNNIESLDKNSYQFGGAIKFSFEIQKFSNFRLSISGGVGKKIPNAEFLYPTLHTELQLYNGGLGSSLMYKYHRRVTLDFIMSILLTAGLNEVSEEGFDEKFNPITYFGDLSATPLHNPYFHSASLGSNYIISSDKNRENQLVGVFNLNIDRTFQFTYYNDGTPFGRLRLGDGYDRYYTGGATISYFGRFTDDINWVELSYHKFTGYQRFAFETANHMQIDFIPYNNPEAYYYNQGRWNFRVANYNHGFGINIGAYDSQFWDVQDRIHEFINNGYHPDAYRKTRYLFGLDYNYVNWNSK